MMAEKSISELEVLAASSGSVSEAGQLNLIWPRATKVMETHIKKVRDISKSEG